MLLNEQGDTPKQELKVKFRPMPGKIVCQVVGERDTYGSGLILKPATRVNPRTTAKIVAVYEPFLLDPSNEDSETESYLKKGDTVIFGLHSGIEVEYGSEKVIILREQEILCIVEASEDTIAQTGVAAGAFDDLEE